MTQERFFELVYAWKDGDLTGDELYQRVFVEEKSIYREYTNWEGLLNQHIKLLRQNL